MTARAAHLPARLIGPIAAVLAAIAAAKAAALTINR